MIQPLLPFYDWAILALRIVLGVILLAHGLPKLKNFSGTTQWFLSVGFKPATFWTGIAIAVEVLGGVLLIAGLFTQIVAALCVVQFLVALLKVKRTKGLVGGYELDLLIVAVAVLLMTSGAGSMSVDGSRGILIY